MDLECKVPHGITSDSLMLMRKTSPLSEAVKVIYSVHRSPSVNRKLGSQVGRSERLAGQPLVGTAES